MKNYQKEFDDSYEKRWKYESGYIIRYYIENDRLKNIFYNTISFLNEDGEYFEVIVIKDFYNNIMRVIEDLMIKEKTENVSLKEHQEFTRKSYSELAPKLILILELSNKEGKSEKVKQYKEKLSDIVYTTRSLSILDANGVGQKFNIKLD